MKLEDLVSYFREGNSYEDFCKQYSIDSQTEVIEVYMKKPFKLDSEIFFFEAEKTGDLIEYKFNDTLYYNLFDFYYFMDVIEESNESSNKNLKDLEIARVLLSYAIHDA